MEFKLDDALLNKLKTQGFPLTGGYIAVRTGLDSFAFSNADGFTSPWQTDGDGLMKLCPTARRIFEKNGELTAVLFTPAKYAAEITAEFIPPVLDDMAQIVGARAEVADKDDEGTASVVARSFGCIVRGQGTLSAGRSVEQAFTVALVLEKAARVYTLSKRIGGAKPLPTWEAKLMHLIYTKKYSRTEARSTHRTAVDFDRELTERELTLREEIVRLGKLLTAENLVQGTWGNISIRLDDRYMLATPSGMEYPTLTPYDIVRVDMRSMEYEGSLKPTAERGLHAASYLEHKETNCVIHTHSPECSVFAAAHKGLAGAPRAAYGLPGTKKLTKNVVAALKEDCAAIMDNHGMVARGGSPEEALELCRSLEHSARELLIGD